ncbi:MAG: topoisomerase [Nanoarchaeota archaeon]|nr:topoisomerase [Nanoarchaeota archaeon]
MDTLTDWVESLKESKKAIVVEGKKDVRALAAFGIEAFPIEGRSVLEAAEAIAAKSEDCVILTDLDKEGRRLYSMLKHYLSQMGVRIDNKFREWLFRETKLRQIEGLVSYLESLTDRLPE